MQLFKVMGLFMTTFPLLSLDFRDALYTPFSRVNAAEHEEYLIKGSAVGAPGRLAVLLEPFLT